MIKYDIQTDPHAILPSCFKAKQGKTPQSRNMKHTHILVSLYVYVYIYIYIYLQMQIHTQL